ncbi:hypothetical protein B0H17DRAFT_434633 [Mycena rosella]|uniref:Uncharacterized protein n=1 Tax=Mycena rosella TaxID=1033263 RepID=A0AAD7DNQ5_MYCRO|nr:hypothetical protein B0H17DRAFT_434633 [Mycena rosella]
MVARFTRCPSSRIPPPAKLSETRSRSHSISTRLTPTSLHSSLPRLYPFRRHSTHRLMPPSVHSSSFCGMAFHSIHRPQRSPRLTLRGGPGKRAGTNLHWRAKKGRVPSSSFEPRSESWPSYLGASAMVLL